MTVRQIEPIDRAELRATIQKWIDAHTDVDDTDGVGLLEDVLWEINAQPTLTPPNEPMTWEELKSETKINPVYSVKYGWIFPSTVKDEPYKQIWFFTSKGFAQTELFYRDTFYRHPPEGES